MASLRTVYERAVEAIQQAMVAAVTEPRTVLALAKELRALLRQMSEAVVSAEPAAKDERMAALARLRHAKGDAAAHAEPMRQPMRQPMRESCGNPCERDAATHAETPAAAPAASRAPVVFSGTYSESFSTSEPSASEGDTSEACTAEVQQRAREGDAKRLREACEDACASDAASDAKPVRRTREDRIAEVEHSPAFLAFWRAFDHKTGKPNAARSWLRIDPDEALAEEITRAAAAYAKSTPDKLFRKHPATWLNARGWEDEIARPAGSAAGGFDRNGKWGGVPRVQPPGYYQEGKCDENGVPIQ
jgi:hypothetical protein